MMIIILVADGYSNIFLTYIYPPPVRTRNEIFFLYILFIQVLCTIQRYRVEVSKYGHGFYGMLYGDSNIMIYDTLLCIYELYVVSMDHG